MTEIWMNPSGWSHFFIFLQLSFYQKFSIGTELCREVKPRLIFRRFHVSRLHVTFWEYALYWPHVWRREAVEIDSSKLQGFTIAPRARRGLCIARRERVKPMKNRPFDSNLSGQTALVCCQNDEILWDRLLPWLHGTSGDIQAVSLSVVRRRRRSEW